MLEMLWKEYREKRMWALPLIVSTTGVVLLKQGYTFVGEIFTFTAWLMPSTVVAVLFGMMAYSVEIAGDTADFLYSRPMSWKRILLAKLIVGFGIIIACAVFAACVYRLACPEPYVRFAGPLALARGVGLAVGLMGLPYLLGVVCSVVFPGILGGILTLMAVGSVLAIQIGASHHIFPELYFRFWKTAELLLFLVRLFAILTGLGAAFIITVRFGLTLQTPRRALRYAMFVVVAVVLISPLSFVARHDAILSKVVPKLLVRQNRYLQDPPDVSPDGRYAIVCQIRWKRANADITKRYWMVRLSDGKRERITMPEWRSTYWTPSDAVYYLEHGLGRENRSSVLWIVRMDDCGRITQKHVRVGYGVGFFLWPSPDRRFAIVSSHMRESDNRMATTLEFVDVENARRLPIIIRGVSKHFAADWWQTNRKVGYLDAKGNRRFIILPD